MSGPKVHVSYAQRPLDACLRLLEREGFIFGLEGAFVALADGEDDDALESGAPAARSRS